MTAMTIMIIGDSTHSGSRHDAVLTLVRKGHYVYPTTHDSTGCNHGPVDRTLTQRNAPIAACCIRTI